MTVTIEFETYMDYAATTLVGKNLCDLPINIQERLNEIFDGTTLTSTDHPDNIYVNCLQIIALKDLYNWDEITKNFDLPNDEAELEEFFYENKDEIIDILDGDYFVLGVDKTDIYISY